MSKSIIKEISEAVVVFLFALFITASSLMRKYVMRGEDYKTSDLAVAAVLAVVLTTLYFFFKRKYARDSKQNEIKKK
ncbi:MAG: hypothetical protein OIN66_09800 [Candidatus Methanoperedens sp.]|nr:hypothetical protein [Candidatus Methanoperedens sp.]